MSPANLGNDRADRCASPDGKSVAVRLSLTCGVFVLLAVSGVFDASLAAGPAQAPAAPALAATPPVPSPAAMPAASSSAARSVGSIPESPAAPPLTPSGVATLADLAKPNVLVIIRHANAPGVGDPAGYNLDDCATQRNLDDKGREQAAAIGRAWKQAGIFPTRVWTSAWCRCIETAQRMALGPVALLPQLNSSFEDAGSRSRQTDALFQFIRNLKPNGGPYLMVTHQVNISAISNDWVETGAGVVLDLKKDGTWTMRKLAQ